MTMQMQQTQHQEEPVCRHCGEAIRETSDNATPYVHSLTGNAFCDVLSVADAVEKRGTPGRTVAEPEHIDECELCGADLEPSSDWLWHRPDADCRSITHPFND